MFRLYTPVIIIQCFCLYHAYSRNAPQKWYWLIIFFPFIGSLIYLYYNFYTQSNIDTVSEGVIGLFNSNYELEQLEKEVKYSDTVANKTRLADKHAELGNYDQAISLLQASLDRLDEKDPGVLKRLIKVNFLKKDYPSVVQFGQQLDGNQQFRYSEERIAYAWSLHYQGQSELAEESFKAMDQQFSNYQHRMEYGKLLALLGKQEAAKAKLNELLEEIDHMDRQEKRMKRDIYRAIKDLYQEIS